MSKKHNNIIQLNIIYRNRIPYVNKCNRIEKIMYIYILKQVFKFFISSKRKCERPQTNGTGCSEVCDYKGQQSTRFIYTFIVSYSKLYFLKFVVASNRDAGMRMQQIIVFCLIVALTENLVQTPYLWSKGKKMLQTILQTILQENSL